MLWQRDSGSRGCCHLPGALCLQGPVNSRARANTRIQLLGQEALETEVAGGSAERGQQEVLQPSPCSWTLPAAPGHFWNSDSAPGEAFVSLAMASLKR